MFGVDVSYSALGRAPNRRRVAGDLSHLPFRDESFDFVLVSEVVEHIPVDALPKVVVELRRVSCKYILITVPYRERSKMLSSAVPVVLCSINGDTFKVLTNRS